jgi:hypothetical protein
MPENTNQETEKPRKKGSGRKPLPKNLKKVVYHQCQLLASQSIIDQFPKELAEFSSQIDKIKADFWAFLAEKTAIKTV